MHHVSKAIKQIQLEWKTKVAENQIIQMKYTRMFLFPLAGSPFSTSEPSIEPEGQSSGGAEDNYHRNMSWLHVGPFKRALVYLRVEVFLSSQPLTPSDFPRHRS